MARKISENIWEIKKEGKMNVPVRIFASDVLMDKIKEDKTLEQAKNMAMMQGVVEKIVVLPDAHQGYGACIGGVAAYDLEKGVISPGQNGYDINCLTGGSLILTEFGQSIKIEDFEKNISEIRIEQNGMIIKKAIFNTKLKTINLESRNQENKEINLFMSRESNDVFKICLKSGLTIKATSDHPFLTKEGMINLGKLRAKQELAVNLFSGIEENCKIDRTEAIIAKLLGYLFGDGNFNCYKGKYRAVAYGKKEDLQDIKSDLESIGINSSLFSRTRNHRIKTRYGLNEFKSTNNELHIYNRNFLLTLKDMGLAIGNKTRQEIKVPDWIKKSNKTLKRLFLAGFFGAEMSSPSTSSKTCFYCPVIDQNKITSLKQNCRDFLIDIALLLEEFGINHYKISEMDDFVNKYGEKTSRLRLIITSEENMLILWRKIGFEYNRKRQVLSNIASLYLLLKKRENKKRVELGSKIKDFKKRGILIGEVKRILGSEINERFIERHYYENAGQRINLDFISFSEFKKIKSVEFFTYRSIFDNIVSITREEGLHKVYDFNVQDNHTFIANGFIVSNCGVRLLSTNLTKDQFLLKRKETLNELYKNIPSGVGKGSEFKLSETELNEVLNTGVQWALKKSYATSGDLEKIEDNGCIKGADASKVSQKAKARGRNQLGSLGSGNHFLEIQELETIFDEKTAEAFGLKEKGQIVIMLHSGSRGLGHQTATDYINAMEKEYGFSHLPDRELACAPINSKLGKDYNAAMSAAANFAFVNRQLITYQIRKTFRKFFPNSEINLIYDITHNIVKFEEHEVNGKKQMLCVHRKGATRSFGPERKEIPEIYRKLGCPIFIPGSMGTFSYVLIGTKKAEELSFGSTAHGAGRVLSRSYAIKNLSTDNLKRELESKNVMLKAGSMKGALEEAPEAYKDINEVARVSHELGIGQLVARTKPLAVIKG